MRLSRILGSAAAPGGIFPHHPDSPHCNCFAVRRDSGPFACPQNLLTRSLSVNFAVIGVAGIEQRQDMRMLQPRRGADLGEEAFAAEGGAEVGVQHLDGDVDLDAIRENAAVLARLAAPPNSANTWSMGKSRAKKL